MTTETYQYRGYDIVPMWQWSSWCTGNICEACRLAHRVTIYSLDHGARKGQSRC